MLIHPGDDHAFEGVPMTPQGLGSCFLGVQSLDVERPQTQRLLSFLAHCIPLCSGDLDSQVLMNQNSPCSSELQVSLGLLQAVANIVLGLKSSSSRSQGSRQVLQALNAQLAKQATWWRSLKGQEVSMCLWGLQGMEVDLPEVNDFLLLLNDALDRRKLGNTKEKAPSVASWPRRAVSSTSAANQSSFIHKKESQSAALEFRTFEEISLLLAGMKSMHSNSAQLLRLLRHVSEAMRAFITSHSSPNPSPSPNPPPVITGSQLAGALYGLQRMSDEATEVRSVLRG